MKPAVSFFVNGLPKGQPRPRAFARKMGNKFVARVFDAGTAEEWKGQIAQAAKDHTPTTPFDGPVYLYLNFLFPRPKSHFRANGTLKMDAPLFHTGKPDADNLAKAVMDALTQLGGFWSDDATIAQLFIAKAYCRNAGCAVEIKEACED